MSDGTAHSSASTFYFAGGTLTGDAACYVPRQADTQLLDALRQGQFCYVLTPRQMGKSSLMVRAAERLREEGYPVVLLDLTELGANLSVEQWYYGLLRRLGEQVNLPDELIAFWRQNKELGPLSRFLSALRQVALPTLQQPLVVFVDEIDYVRSLPFSTDEFFAGIRECYNRRAQDPIYHRLTFCLLGVATPSDLIRDPSTTPFNIGTRVELRDFTSEEAAPLAKGLEGERGRRGAIEPPPSQRGTSGLGKGVGGLGLLNRVLYWTGGHPYLTQRLCQAVAEHQTITDPAGVDEICETLFLSPRARERDNNLLFVRESLLRNEANLARLLELYAEIHGGARVKDDEANPIVSILNLSGITRSVLGYLQVRNLIYAHVFDRKWAWMNMPEWQRVQPISLLWQKRYRGVLPITTGNVSAEGDVLTICPDEIEARLYRVLELSASSHARELFSLSIEKVFKWEVRPDGNLMLGMARSRLYLFQQGHKTRLLTDRHAAYSDISLARDAGLFGYACCDIMGESPAIGVSDWSGKQGWIKDLPAAAQKVALSADGRLLVASCLNGEILAVNAASEIVWRFNQEKPISALALHAAEGPCAVGTEQGQLLLLDQEARVSWRADIGLPVIAIDVTEAGDGVAAAGDSTGGLLACFAPDGRSIWEMELDSLPTGVAFAPNGRFLAASLQDGHILLFEVNYGTLKSSDQAQQQVLSEMEEILRTGSLNAAYQRLLHALHTHPHHVQLGQKLTEVAEAMIAQRLAVADRYSASGDHEVALALLTEAQKLFPYNELLFAHRCALHRAAKEQLRREANGFIDVHDLNRARARLKELLRLDPHDAEARQQLAEISGTDQQNTDPLIGQDAQVRVTQSRHEQNVD